VNDFQRQCVTAINRELRPLRIQPTYEIRVVEELPCVCTDFHIVEDHHRIFIYPDEVAVCRRGRREVLALREFDNVGARLFQALVRSLGLDGGRERPAGGPGKRAT